MRRYYWYISTFFRKHGVVVLLTVIGAIILFSIFLPFLLRTLDLKQKKYIGVVGSYTLQSLPLSIQRELSNGLTSIADDGTPIPALAERWTTEDDGKTYRFVIKRNLVWQNGDPFVPADVTYSFPNVQIITTTNDVLFKLPNKFVPFSTTVSQPVLKLVDEPYLLFFKRKKLLGTGKYEMIDYHENGQRLTEVVLSSPREQKVYRFYLTEEDAILGFKRGEVDHLQDFSSIGDLEKWPNVKIDKSIEPQRYLGVFFNTSDSTLSLNEIRQALNYSVEKPSDDTRVKGPISPTSWAFSDVGKTYDYDMSRAVERLLSKVNEVGQPINIKLTTTQIFLSEAEKIAQSWRQLGEQAFASCKKDSNIKEKQKCDNLRITVEIKISNFPDVNDFQALLVGQEIPTDPDQYNLWHSDEPTNFTHYSNPKIDALLEKGRQTDNREERFEIYQNFQQSFSENPPVIFIRHLYAYDINRK